MVMVVLLLYMFACFGTEFIGKNESLLASDDSEVTEIVLERFQGIFMTMLSLVQVFSGDVTENFFPLIVAEPALVLYFGAAYFLLGILLMNLVTANLVNDAIASSQEDQDMKFKKLQQMVSNSKPKLTELFEALDVDGTGDISLHELICGVQEASKKPDLDEAL